jgi:hypothetical protein
MIEIASLIAIIVSVCSAISSFVIGLKLRGCRSCCCNAECADTIDNNNRKVDPTESLY